MTRRGSAIYQVFIAVKDADANDKLVVAQQKQIATVGAVC